MAVHDNVALAADTWTQLTDANAGNVMIQNQSSVDVWISGTASASAPSDKSGSIKLGAHEAVKDAITSLWPGIAVTRIYAIAHHPAQVQVSIADA